MLHINSSVDVSMRFFRLSIVLASTGGLPDTSLQCRGFTCLMTQISSVRKSNSRENEYETMTHWHVISLDQVTRSSEVKAVL